MAVADTVFSIDARKIARRRAGRRIHLPVDVGIIVVGVALAVVGALAPSLLGVVDPALHAVGIVALLGIGAYAFWSDSRALRRINAAAISSRGLYPPFKPRERLSWDDWFVSYRDILSMQSTTEKGDFVTAYGVNLRDGLTFQLNALDLLLYVNEAEARLYARMLAVIRTELQRPENRASAQRGEDVIIEAERFEAFTGG